MSLHLDGPSVLAIVLAVGAVLGVFLFRKKIPQRSVGLEVSHEPGGDRLIIRFSNDGLPGLVLDEVGLSCTDRQPYSGKAWGSSHSELRLHLEPGSPPVEFWLDYRILIDELHRGGAGLKQAWAVDTQERVYTCCIPIPLLRQMMYDLQKLNEGED